jgi:hypothetical protein
VDTTPDGLYVRKHDPFLMYPDVYNNPQACDRSPQRSQGCRPGPPRPGHAQGLAMQ